MLLFEPVLVLNHSWVPIGTYTVRKAFKKIISGKAKIVDHEDCSLHDFESWIQLPVRDGDKMFPTYMAGFRVPEIIVINSDGRLGRRKMVVAFSRKHLMKRDNHCCQYCGKQKPQMTIDHILPKARGGKSSWTNCVMSCLDCNFKKADKTPEEAGLRLLKRPTEPTWSPIFRVSMNKYKTSWRNFLPEKVLAK
jgi:hypothetical protein